MHSESICEARTACVAEWSHTYGVLDIGSLGAVDAFSTMYCGVSDPYCNTFVYQSSLDSQGDDLTIVNATPTVLDSPLSQLMLL